MSVSPTPHEMLDLHERREKLRLLHAVREKGGSF
jgi:hypothetical protein